MNFLKKILFFILLTTLGFGQLDAMRTQGEPISNTDSDTASRDEKNMFVVGEIVAVPYRASGLNISGSTVILEQKNPDVVLYAKIVSTGTGAISFGGTPKLYEKNNPKQIKGEIYTVQFDRFTTFYGAEEIYKLKPLKQTADQPSVAQRIIGQPITDVDKKNAIRNATNKFDLSEIVGVPYREGVKAIIGQERIVGAKIPHFILYGKIAWRGSGHLVELYEERNPNRLNKNNSDVYAVIISNEASAAEPPLYATEEIYKLAPLSQKPESKRSTQAEEPREKESKREAPTRPAHPSKQQRRGTKRIPGNDMTDEDKRTATKDESNVFEPGEIVGFILLVTYPNGSKDAFYRYAEVVRYKANGDVELKCPYNYFDNSGKYVEKIGLIQIPPRKILKLSPEIIEISRREKIDERVGQLLSNEDLANAQWNPEALERNEIVGYKIDENQVIYAQVVGLWRILDQPTADLKISADKTKYDIDYALIAKILPAKSKETKRVEPVLSGEGEREKPQKTEEKEQKRAQTKRVLDQPLSKFDLDNAQWKPAKNTLQVGDIVGYRSDKDVIYAKIKLMSRGHVAGGYWVDLTNGNWSVPPAKIAKLPPEQIIPTPLETVATSERTSEEVKEEEEQLQEPAKLERILGQPVSDEDLNNVQWGIKDFQVKRGEKVALRTKNGIFYAEYKIGQLNTALVNFIDANGKKDVLTAKFGDLAKLPPQPLK